MTDDQNRLFETGVTIPYSEEYRPRNPDEELLTSIAKLMGGSVVTDPKEVFRSLPKPRRRA